MQYVILGALGLAVLYGAAQLALNLDARTLVRVARYVLSAVLLLAGVGLTLARQVALGLPAIFFGLVLLFRGRLGSWDFGTSTHHGGQASSVRSRFIEASLDHDSGELSGTVREGQFAGRALDELTEAELHALYQEVRGDTDSEALVEAYLDRRFPGWRDDAEGDADAGTGGAADAGAMTDKEAYEILGLSPGASEADIRAAHRRLLKGVHPDQGGSTFLAARINQAKDWLLSKHRSHQ